MTIYTEPIPQKILNYMQAHPFDANMDMVLARVTEQLKKNGYQIGAKGVAIDGVNGMMMVDADRNPNASIAELNPLAELDAELAQTTLRQQVIAGLTTLGDDEKVLKGPPAPTAAQVRDATLHVNQGLQRLVKILINQGVLKNGGGS